MLVSYQLHSVNDLREWNAWFVKGGTALKIDPHFVPGVAPGPFSFILSHDTPLFEDGLPKYNYSTLNGVLDYFRNGHHPPIRGNSVEVSLCFKARPDGVCSERPSKDASNWLDAVDDFFAEANNVIRIVKQSNDLDLSFVLDGAAKPCGCLADRWRPWESVWTHHDDCSLACFRSDGHFCQRFTRLNDSTDSDWKGMANSSVHYGKFGLQTNTSLRVWEPDKESDICGIIDTYSEGRDAGVPSGRELSFAINFDPAMFDVFVSGCVFGKEARGFNAVVGKRQNGNGETNPHLSAVGENRFILSYELENGVLVEEALDLSDGTFERLRMKPLKGRVDRANDNTSSVLVLNDVATQCLIRWNDTGQCLWHPGAKALPFSGSITSALLRAVHDNHIFVFACDGFRIYGAYLNRKNNATDYVVGFHLLGFGKGLETSHLSDQLLLVTEGNRCYNSHSQNTQSHPLVCDVVEHPDESGCGNYGMLDYTLGHVNDWIDWLSTPGVSKSYTTVLTPCNERLLHGTFSSGSNPSSALFELVDGRTGVLVAGERCNNAGGSIGAAKGSESSCGTPRLGVNGIVISAFGVSLLHENDSNSPKGDGSDDGGNIIPGSHYAAFMEGLGGTAIVLLLAAMVVLCGWKSSSRALRKIDPPTQSKRKEYQTLNSE